MAGVGIFTVVLLFVGGLVGLIALTGMAERAMRKRG